MSGKSDSEFGELQRYYLTTADRLRQLERLLEDMNNQRFSEELLSECPNLAKKIVENEKLKYRIDILKRVSSLFQSSFIIAHVMIVHKRKLGKLVIYPLFSIRGLQILNRKSRMITFPYLELHFKSRFLL